MKTRIRLKVAYDGTDYLGWQRQKTTSATVQGHIELALSQIFNEAIQVIGASRTDTGVHAFGQNLHFDTSKDPSRYQLLRSLNSLLPHSISARQAWLVPEGFHALLSSRGKSYKYRIYNSPTPNPILRRYSHWEPRPLDLNFLQEASDFLLGEQDFKSFQTAGSPVPSTIRRIFKAHWQPVSGNLLEFHIVGSGFLKQMVRNILGSLLDLHFRQAPASRIQEILAARDRRAALGTAPPEGLFLMAVHYPKETRQHCQAL